MKLGGSLAGSLLFATGLVISTAFAGSVQMLILPLPYKIRYAVAQPWVYFVLWWLKVTCKIDFQVQGTEHIPKQASVILSKHQSAWETIAFQSIFPPQVWVLKRELLWIPVFGWALKALGAISIDRGNKRHALRKILKQGEKRLKQGRWIVVFPEGTRLSPGEHKRYALSGALLARENQCPVVPVAHNAGSFWPRKGLAKVPGTVQVRIGPVIEPDKSAAEITAQAEAWIEETMQTLYMQQTPV